MDEVWDSYRYDSLKVVNPVQYPHREKAKSLTNSYFLIHYMKNTVK